MKMMDAWMINMMVTVLSSAESRVWKRLCIMKTGVRGSNKQQRQNTEEI
jgi:hypothetical protein